MCIFLCVAGLRISILSTIFFFKVKVLDDSIISIESVLLLLLSAATTAVYFAASFADPGYVKTCPSSDIKKKAETELNSVVIKNDPENTNVASDDDSTTRVVVAGCIVDDRTIEKPIRRLNFNESPASLSRRCRATRVQRLQKRPNYHAGAVHGRSRHRNHQSSSSSSSSSSGGSSSGSSTHVQSSTRRHQRRRRVIDFDSPTSFSSITSGDSWSSNEDEDSTTTYHSKKNRGTKRTATRYRDMRRDERRRHRRLNQHNRQCNAHCNSDEEKSGEYNGYNSNTSSSSNDTTDNDDQYNTFETKKRKTRRARRIAGQPSPRTRTTLGHYKQTAGSEDSFSFETVSSTSSDTESSSASLSSSCDTTESSLPSSQSFNASDNAANGEYLSVHVPTTKGQRNTARGSTNANPVEVAVFSNDKGYSDSTMSSTTTTAIPSSNATTATTSMDAAGDHSKSCMPTDSHRYRNLEILLPNPLLVGALEISTSTGTDLKNRQIYEKTSPRGGPVPVPVDLYRRSGPVPLPVDNETGQNNHGRPMKFNGRTLGHKSSTKKPKYRRVNLKNSDGDGDLESGYGIRRQGDGMCPILGSHVLGMLSVGACGEIGYRNVFRKKKRKMYQYGAALRFCKKCGIYQPLRCKHCSECNRCVRTHDHHCPWLGTCVGERNRCLFYWYLATQSFELTVAIVMVVVALFRFTSNNRHKAVSNDDNVVNVVVGLISNIVVSMVMSLVLLLVFSLLTYHSFLAIANITTWENMRWGSITYLRNLPEDKGSPFSRSFRSNIATYCCPSWLPLLLRRCAQRWHDTSYGKHKEILWEAGKQHAPPLVSNTVYNCLRCQ